MKNNANSKKGREAHLINELTTFMEEKRLFPESGQAYIGLSGGIDSMVLLSLLISLRKRNPDKIQSIQAIHINHGTRGEENRLDEELVQRFCHDHSIPIFVEYFPQEEKSSKSGNFEARARKFRYQSFKKFLRAGDFIYLAHHLDDSFEWALMQQFKSSEWRQLSGIPVKNGQVVRPLLFLPKESIRSFAKQKKIPFREDSSNSNLKYERNFVRNALIPLIKKRYPAYLENFRARNEKLFSLPFAKKKFQVEKILFENQLKERKIVGYQLTFLGEGQGEKEQLITEVIKKLSADERGVLRDQVRKMVRAQKNGKWGPMIFSGKVTGHILPQHILLLNELGKQLFRQLDQKIVQQLESSADKKIDLQMIFPFIFVGESYQGVRIQSLKKSYPLFPQTTQWLIEKSLSWNFLPNIRNSLKKMKKSGIKDL